jgi:hypothetical protein
MSDFDASLTQEEKDAETFIEWSNETLGRAVREMSRQLVDMNGRYGLMGTAGFIAIQKAMVDRNAAQLEVTIKGVHLLVEHQEAK